MKVWWLKKPIGGNFGDIITPVIFEYFNIPCEYSKYNIEAISVGSIAKVASKDVIVLGSGILDKTDKLCPEADWRFVRGPLTRSAVTAVGGSCPEIYGDPGLLLPLMCNESKKEHDVGIVPHYYDYERVKLQYPNYNVINLINKDPLAVAKEITKCRTIISGSLHGIVCAHAYGIPAAWVHFSDLMLEQWFKFRDYYLSVNEEAIPSTVKDPLLTTGTFDIKPMIDIFSSL